MTTIAGPAIICAVRAHGEHGAIVRAMSAEAGLLAGYVQGGRSTRMRPVLLAGNLVTARFRSRTPEQLASLSVELTESRGPLLSEPLPAAAIDWVCAVTATVLPEGHPYPAVYASLGAVLDAIAAAPAARGWSVALIRYELLLLAELGFGLDLSRCAVTGASDNLAYVSPRSGRSVSRSGGQGYADRLLPLPPFLIGEGEADWDQIFTGLDLTEYFLDRMLLADRRTDILSARGRLVERLKRAVA